MAGSPCFCRTAFTKSGAVEAEDSVVSVAAAAAAAASAALDAIFFALFECAMRSSARPRELNATAMDRSL